MGFEFIQSLFLCPFPNVMQKYALTFNHNSKVNISYQNLKSKEYFDGY